MDNSLKAIRKDAFINGLILAAILLVLDIVALYIWKYSSSAIVIILTYFFGYLLLPLLGIIFLIKRLRSKIGYWNLRQATSGIFIMVLSAYIISSIASFLFINFIDKSISYQAKENIIHVLGIFFNSLNVPVTKIDKFMLNIEHIFSSMTELSFQVILANLIYLILKVFLASFIFAAIFKREQPINYKQSDLS